MSKLITKILTALMLLTSAVCAYDEPKQVRASHILVKTRAEAIQIKKAIDDAKKNLVKVSLKV